MPAMAEPALEPSPPPPADAGETELLARLKAGDPRAFEQLVRDLGPRMLATAKRFLPGDDDAQDAVQEAFISAIRALPNFEGHSRLSTWIHRILVNACLMKLRSRQRRPERLIDDLLPRFAEDGHHAEPVAAWTPPEAGLEQTELRTLVRSAIDQLPETYRTVLLARDIEGLDTEATATLLGMTPAAVKTRLHRARLALRELLNPHFRGGSP